MRLLIAASASSSGPAPPGVAKRNTHNGGDDVLKREPRGPLPTRSRWLCGDPKRLRLENLSGGPRANN
jgi:hypothetical protein